ncbi:MAG: TVP38/TMEM64 family protein [Hyphomicrobiaceae bacterium]|nr:TVP38/TMEM64 family protein [Hyphomicrobiaceae bacterium]
MTHDIDHVALTKPTAGTPAWRRLLAPVVLLAGFVIVWSTGLVDWLDLDRVVAGRAGLRAALAQYPLAVALAYVAIYVAVVALSLPGGLVLTLAGGLLFGGIVGAAIAAFAATLGSVAVFLAARAAFAEGLRARAGPFLARFVDGFHSNAFSYLLFLRLVPVFPFWLVNLAPALLGVNLRTYTLATVIGIIPGTLAFAFVGAGLDSIVAAQIAANPACAGGMPCELHLNARALVTPEIIAALVALGIAALIPALLKAWRRG